MTTEQIRELVGRLNAGAGSLAALGAALDAKVNGIVIEPQMQPHIDALVTALGGSDALADLTGAELRPVLAEIRTFGLLNTKLLFAGTRTSGWAHTDETLQATGEISMAFPHTLIENGRADAGRSVGPAGLCGRHLPRCWRWSRYAVNRDGSIMADLANRWYRPVGTVLGARDSQREGSDMPEEYSIDDAKAKLSACAPGA